MTTFSFLGKLSLYITKNTLHPQSQLASAVGPPPGALPRAALSQRQVWQHSSQRPLYHDGTSTEGMLCGAVIGTLAIKTCIPHCRKSKTDCDLQIHHVSEEVMEEDKSQVGRTWGSEKCCGQFMVSGDVFDLFYYINKPPNHWRHPSETQYPYCERERVQNRTQNVQYNAKY